MADWRCWISRKLEEGEDAGKEEAVSRRNSRPTSSRERKRSERGIRRINKERKGESYRSAMKFKVKRGLLFLSTLN